MGSSATAAGAKRIQSARPVNLASGGAAGARAHPADAEADEQQREEKGGDAEGLEQGVGQKGADEADEVVRGVELAGVAAGGVEGGVRGGVAGEREQKQRGRGKHEDAENLVKAMVTGRLQLRREGSS